MRWITTRKTSESPSEETVLSRPLLDEWVQGGECPSNPLSPMTYQQESYEGYSESGTAPTLKASGGNYGGGTEVLILHPPRRG